MLINKWLARGALDIIGQGMVYAHTTLPSWYSLRGLAAFDYNFGALDDTENPLAKEYSTIM